MNYVTISIISIIFVFGIISILISFFENNIDKPYQESIIRKRPSNNQRYITDKD